jgi:hypothetical protein
MRKVLWCCAAVVVCTAAGAVLLAGHVRRHPDSLLARGVTGVYRATSPWNPFVRFSRAVTDRIASTQKSAPAAPAACPEQVAQVCDRLLKEELPPVQMLGTITIPEDVAPGDPVTPPSDAAGSEEASECLPMPPLEVSEAPLSMPYLQPQTSRVSRLLETDFGDEAGGSEECEPPADAQADCADDAMGSNPCHPHPSCTQPVVCPYTGKCYSPEPTRPHCESDDEEPMKDILGAEPKEPKSETPAEMKPAEEPQEPMNEMGPTCPHGGYRQIICPYTGKCYPVEPEPCEPKATEPEIKAEEQQEVAPAEQSKPEKKKEIKKKRKVRHKLYLLEGEPAPRQEGDTLEFRPSDAKPNEFGLIPL